MDQLLRHPILIASIAAVAGIVVGWIVHYFTYRGRHSHWEDEWQRKIVTAEEECQTRRDEAQTKSASLALLRSQHDKASQELKVLREQSEAGGALDQLKGEIETLQFQLAQATSRHKRSDDSLNDLMEKTDALLVERNTLQQKFDEQYDEVERLRKDRNDWQQKAEHSRSDLSDRNHTLAATEDRLDKISEQLAMRETEVAAREKTLDQLQSDYEQVCRELETHKAHLSESQQLVDQITMANSDEKEVNQLKSNFERYRTALAEREQQLADACEQIDLLSEKLEQLTPPPPKPPPPAPQGLLDHPPGDADDLKRIKGIGAGLEKRLNQQGIYHFGQIAGFSDQDLEWLDSQLGAFRGRAVRDHWVAQATKFQTQRPSQPAVGVSNASPGASAQ